METDWNATGAMIGGLGAWAQLGAALIGIRVAYMLGRDTAQAQSIADRAARNRLLRSLAAVATRAETLHDDAVDDLAMRSGATASEIAEATNAPQWRALLAALDAVPLYEAGDLDLIVALLDLKAITLETFQQLDAVRVIVAKGGVANKLDSLVNRQTLAFNAASSVRRRVDQLLGPR